MTRMMVDCEHAAIPTVLATLPPSSYQLVAGYVTGTPDIQWTSADWKRFPSVAHVLIDQGGPGSPVYSANVMDVEPLAYRPDEVHNWTTRSTAPAPTVYCDRSDLPAVLAAGWRGDVWLAYPDWTPGEPLPVVPGRIVAVQSVFASSYDLSYVLDPNWPEVDKMAAQAQPGWAFCSACGVLFYATAGKQACPGNNGGAHVADANSSHNYSVLYG